MIYIHIQIYIYIIVSLGHQMVFFVILNAALVIFVVYPHFTICQTSTQPVKLD